MTPLNRNGGDSPQNAPAERDTTPAVGSAGGPASWRPADAGGEVELHVGEWRDGRWSYLYGEDTRYGEEGVDTEAVAAAARRARGGEGPGIVQGPVMKPPVWTWEVPLYFWFGGIAAGSSFVALGCDLAGDRRSAAIARKVAMGALAPAPALLVMDLGRPARFLNMLRIFKPRSPMSTGSWALSLFGTLGGAAVAADVLDSPRMARALGGANAVVGSYLGSYTGVLLAATAVPVWARSRLLLGPIFVATATASGAAATRLALVVAGLSGDHPTRHALDRVQGGAMAAELALSAINERGLRRHSLAGPLEEGRGGRLFTAARWAARAGLAAGAASRVARGRARRRTRAAARGRARRRTRAAARGRADDAASILFLAAALAFRYAWIQAGRASAGDHEAVARMARREAQEPGAEPADVKPRASAAPGG